jgi:hypothetical protein
MPIAPSTRSIETTQGEIVIRALRMKEVLRIQEATRRSSREGATDADRAKAEEAVNAVFAGAIVKGAKKVDELEAWEYTSLVEAIKDLSFGSREKN